MTFTNSLKYAAAATLMCAGSAFAANNPVVLDSGFGVLHVSSAAITNLGYGGITFGAKPGSASVYSSPWMSQFGTAITTDAGNTAITSMDFGGSGWMLKSASLQITYSNISVDIDGKTIYATVTDGLGSDRLALFNAASVIAPATIPTGLALGESAEIDTSMSGLTLTTAAATRIGTVANAPNIVGFLQSIDFGTFDINANVTAVPEPSTYAMAGLGLLAIGAIARRRQSA